MKIAATLRNNRGGKKTTADDTRIFVDFALGNKTIGTVALYMIRDWPSDEPLGYRVLWNNEVVEEMEKGKKQKDECLCNSNPNDNSCKIHN